MPAVSTPAAPAERRRRRIPWATVALVGALAVFAVGVVRLFALRFDVGDVYPPYSTLRSDPLGAKVFFASVDALPGLRAERSLRPLASLGTQPLQPADHDNGERGFTVFYLGADAKDWPYLLEPADAERLEAVMRRGGRVVITFQPTHAEPTLETLASARESHAPPDSKSIHDRPSSRQQAKKRGMPDLITRWGIDFRRRAVRPSSKNTDDTHDIPMPNASPSAGDVEYATPDAALAGRAGPDAAFAEGREAVPWHSAVDFRLDTILARAGRWQRLYERHGRPVIVSRPVGTAGGELILVGDTYFLSNEGLRDDPSPAVLAALLGGGRRVIFDESHLDLVEEPGLVTLARRYRLQGALAAVGLLVALFVWRNVVSLVPSRGASSPDASPDGQDTVAGHPAASGYLNLLRRSVRPPDLPGVCLAQWEQGAAGGRQTIPAGSLDRVRAVLAQETALPARKRSPVAAIYRAMCGAARRKG